MKKILVPVDFSEYSEYAAEVAASITRKSGGRVYLLHVVDIPDYVDTHGVSFDNIPEGIAALKLVKKQFKQFLNKPFFKDVNVGEVVLFDGVYDNIISFADENDIDLIVMGSHGASGFREFFIGSNTQKIVRTANRPVLTIKNRIPDFHVSNLVFASDFNEDVDNAFYEFRKIADYYSAFIHLIKIITKENFESTTESKKKIQDFVNKNSLTKYSIEIFNAYEITEGIIEVAKNKNADLISIATHGRSGFHQIFNESLAEQLVNHSDLPVLSMKL